MRKLSVCSLVIVCILGICAVPALAQTFGQNYSVQLTVQTQKTPPSITLNWVAKSGATAYTIYRRLDVQSGWTAVGNAGNSATSWTDTNVAVGSRYEYQVYANSGAYGYVLAGIEYPLVENRGKLVLLVDSTMSLPLQTELARLAQDLTCDGWVVLRHDVARNSTPAAVKAIITADYQADPTNVKSLFLFGHVPLYYSSNTVGPDAHGGRPHPSDTYYGDMDGTWVDGQMTYIPSTMELQVGRVDLWNMPIFLPLSETDLLRRYLNKDHNYRTKQFNVQNVGIVDDNFATYSEGFTQNGWRNFSPFVGPSNVRVGYWYELFNTGNPPYMWAYGCGPGEANHAGGVADTYQFAYNDPAVFTFIFGSIFGQWDVQDDLMRGELCTPNYGLTCAWAGRPNWFVHHMALGEPIGYSTVQSQNNGITGSYYQPGSQPGGVWVNLMGDPSLRCFMVAPPGSMTATAHFDGNVDLAWTTSSDTVLGYNVYRSCAPGGPFTKVNSDFITGTTYSEKPPAGNEYYMVRAVVLQTTPSGSYYNASQGVTASCNVPFVDITTAGMSFWLKPDSGITKDASNLVSSWADATWSGNDAAQSVGALQPLYCPGAAGGGWAAVRFSGAGSVLQTPASVLSGASPFTVFAYVRPNSTASSQTIYWHGDATGTGGYGAYLSDTANVRTGWGGSSAEITSSDSVSTSKWYQITTTYDGSAHKMWINGASAGSAAKSDSNFTGGVFSLGNYGPSPTQGFNGDVTEVIVYNHALSDGDRTDVGRYLKDKYGKPTALFTALPLAGSVPRVVNFDAGASFDPDGSIVSYVWDFGDVTGTVSGVTASHTYATAGTFAATLYATDNDGHVSSTTTTVVLNPFLTGVSLASSPPAPIGIGTPVTFTATPTGGYQAQYKFFINDGTGWQVLRDYGSSNSFAWASTGVGTYQFKVQAKSSDSPNAYDSESSTLSYVVATIPLSQLTLWLRADAGISATSGSRISSWLDQSSSVNNLSQTTPNLQPTYMDNIINGKPIVRFTGPGQVMQSVNPAMIGSTSFTAFTVGKFSSIPANTYQYLWWTGADSITGGYGCYLNNGGYLRSGWGSNASAPVDTSLATVGNLYRICSRFTSTAGTGPNDMWINGNYIGFRTKNGSNFSGGYFSVGNFGPSPSSGFYGDIGEIMIFSRALADTEIQAIDQYLVGRWIPPAHVSTDKLVVAKGLANNTPVSITSVKVVTAASSGFSDGSYYIEEPDRFAGMKVVGGSVNLWDNVTLSGTVGTDANGEKFILLQTIDSQTPGSDIRSLGMANKSATASGLLCRVWGKVTGTGTGYFIVDDGSGAPVRVDSSGLVAPLTTNTAGGNYVAVTGLAGFGPSGAVTVRPRGDFDVSILAQ